jgi:Methyl-accepting chemotaxis protein
MVFDDLRIHSRDLEALKAFFHICSRSFEDGACLLTSDLDKVTYKSADRFDIPGTDPGTPNRKGTLTDTAIESRKAVVRNMDAGIYGLGMRIRAIAMPVWDDTNTSVVGTIGLSVPRQHKLIHAFDTFAPLLADLLPEGGFFCVTDKEKCVKSQGSKKFDMEQVQPGTPNREGSVSMEVIKQKKLVVQEVDASLYGLPVMSAAAPLADEESGDIVGTFVLILPRKLAHDLKEIAGSLNQGLTGVAASMQQITSSANEVSGNQDHLHREIEKVKEQLEKINKVMAFTKDIADETKMLGLNAAIEAARVGEAGRGFGVVAEEIRKLSEESKKTVTQIKELTKEIEKTMNDTSDASQATLAVVSETSAAVEEVNATIEEMTSLANHLSDTAASL